jgi:hypothetical protein
MKHFFNKMSSQSALHLVRRLAWPTAANPLCATAGLDYPSPTLLDKGKGDIKAPALIRSKSVKHVDTAKPCPQERHTLPLSLLKLNDCA